MLQGFKKFIARGNMVDLAVGVVVGGAVTAVVNSIVDNLINPLIAMLFGEPDLSRTLTVTFNHATISFGAILGALLNFLVIAAVVYFCIVVPINKFRDVSAKLLSSGAKKDEGAQAPVPDEQTVMLLRHIADRLDKMDTPQAIQTSRIPDMPHMPEVPKMH
jgi:large conductance mechanosensitive channel